VNSPSPSFRDYYQTVHGHLPFYWQERLLEEVHQHGWVRPISLPTASGKTSVLDIAVFSLAAQAHLPQTERTAPRRICLVVDRRVVVDDAFRRAGRIAEAIKAMTNTTLSWVANRLAMLGGELPLDVALLRGGIYREDRWARTPLQPVLLCSTVDQVGSRLLHRGYGLSPKTWPIHAGLLAHDTLIILDEAHCAQPFLQTLEAISHLRDQASTRLPGPWSHVAMTATPRADAEPFRLNDTDRQDPVLVRRLQAPKPAVLKLARKKGDEGLAEEILNALHGDQNPFTALGRTTLVVVNRVRVARMIYDKLHIAGPGASGTPVLQVALLTGRSRPVERDAILERYRVRLMAGRIRSAALVPLVVVATQCIEVGADLDVDMLISEVAPLDSLRQRFGRLDRLGELGSSSALLVCRAELAGDASTGALPKDPDPVYGAALSRTWWWLQENVDETGTIDFGSVAMDRRLAASPPPESLTAATPNAPLLLPVYCDLWAQTGPVPAVAPEPSLFLHGAQSGPAEVGVVWRADLDCAPSESWFDIIAACPPLSGEVLPLPLHAARAWLLGAPTDPGSDIEGQNGDDAPDTEGRQRRHALEWRGIDDSRLIGSQEVSPGTTIVVPRSWGGADLMGWTGRDEDKPDDLMDAARIAARRTPILRVHPDCSPFEEEMEPPAHWLVQAKRRADGEDGFPNEHELRVTLLPLLASWNVAPLRRHAKVVLNALLGDGLSIRIHPHPSGEGLLIAGKRRLADAARDFSDEDDLSSVAAIGRVTLADHLDDVCSHARRIAIGVGLPEPLVDALARAGHLHDLGKTDPRFQAWLLGGNWRLVDPACPLAKSDRIRTGRAGAVARRLARYPNGGRHELLSVRLAESAPQLLPEDSALRDLVLHLVASHHGHCRPWAPLVIDERPLRVQYQHEGTTVAASSATGLERIDSGVADRFWRLLREYGWWGLSFLEACLRLADHRASEHPGFIAPEEAA